MARAVSEADGGGEEACCGGERYALCPGREGGSALLGGVFVIISMDLLPMSPPSRRRFIFV